MWTFKLFIEKFLSKVVSLYQIFKERYIFLKDFTVISQPIIYLYTVRRLAGNARRLHAGGGIGKARTRANDDVTCSVSDESAPPLA